MDNHLAASDVERLCAFIDLEAGTKEDIGRVSTVYPFRIPTFYASLMERGNPSCPIRLQAVPSGEELRGRGVADPLGEGEISATPSFLARYPGRGVFLVANECAMYCRFCNRRRMVGRGFRPEDWWDETLGYLEGRADIGEVILSGGDPLTLEPAGLDYVLGRLGKIGHIRVRRLSTRMPVVFPEGVVRHREIIRRHAPLWLVIHINHPREVTPEFVGAIRALREAGATVVSQTVLLRRVNDCVHILALLFQRLIELGVKPYYLFQLDDVIGATHFKVRIETGLSIMQELKKRASGLAVPRYAVDITGGLGKVPLEEGYVGARDGRKVFIKNLYGDEGIYMDDGEKTQCNECGICGTRAR